MRTTLGFLLCLCFVAAAVPTKANYTSPVEEEIILILDPGHGGRDPGNLNETAGMLTESQLNLIISKQIGEYVEQYMQNVKVIYTRTDDSYVSLSKRVAIANDANAHFFISIHCNAVAGSSRVYGTETHIHDNTAKVSRALGLMIEKEFKTRAKRHSRGVKNKDDRQMNLQVLWQTKMPTLLVECGFMSNKEEEAFLNSEKGQGLIASAIFRAFRDYVNEQYPHTVKAPEEVAETAPVPTTNETIYRVQIMASTEPVALDIPQFKALGVPVEEIVATDDRAFKYRYFVGGDADKKVVRKMMKEIRRNGFKDAFIVAFPPSPS